jgi:hypothetical protein
VALFSGVFTRHRDTKSMNCGDQLSLFRKVGGGLVGIINIALKGKKTFYFTLSVPSSVAVPEES